MNVRLRMYKYCYSNEGAIYAKGLLDGFMRSDHVHFFFPPLQLAIALRNLLRKKYNNNLCLQELGIRKNTITTKDVKVIP